MLAEPPEVAKGIPRESAKRERGILGLRGGADPRDAAAAASMVF
jgi:hypothetical protein